MPLDPAIKTKQYEHQDEIYQLHRDSVFFGLFWEMGLGKSKLIQDVASYNHAKGKIQLLIVAAPNSVYKNWISQELPKHMAADYIAMAYPKGRTERAQIKKLIFQDPDSWADKLRVLCISFDSIRTIEGFKYVKELMMIYRTFLVPDESTVIKVHGSKITKKLKVLGELAVMKWICTGTPVSESPFAIHSQVEFLCEDFWANYGMASYGAFKNEFGKFRLMRVGKKRFNQLETYRRLDYLHKIIAPISSRLLKEDSKVKLPPKVYTTRTFEMTEKQQALYDEVRTEYTAELDDGMSLDAPLALVRLTRLQQITSGFVGAERVVGEEPIERVDLADENYTQEAFDFAQVNAVNEDLHEGLKIIKKEKKVVSILEEEEKNPRLQLLLDIVGDIRHKVIVWCRFRHDVDAICEALHPICGRYDGATKGKDREGVLDDFRNPDSEMKVLVANIASLSHGVTLTIAQTMVYYSNSFSLERRLQSEDRFHRIGQTAESVFIIDLAADGSVDLHIINTLKNKYQIAAQVMGDKLRKWL